MDALISPWMTWERASAYLSGDAMTENGRRKYSKQFLIREVKAGRLRAAQVGGRGEFLFRQDWLDAYVEERARPIDVVRRRA